MQNILMHISDNILKDIEKELNRWQSEHNDQRLWAGDASLWTNTSEADWLGWLTVSIRELNDIPRIEALKNDLKNADITDVVVLGMGGSSLCPAMLAHTFGKLNNDPRLHVLDSTDPAQIRHLEESLDLKKTIFIVSSKSGTTLEPNIFKDYFYDRLQIVLETKEVGDRFLAITDPGTPLSLLAKNEKFRTLFEGVPSIGGRYSALSNFGMVPAGLMGIDIKSFLGIAEKMVETCAAAVLAKDNPGVVLGTILAIAAKHGKDKVTFIVSPKLEALGAWLEQLLAESTGKFGKGLIPIDLEPLGKPDSYSLDRLFIYIRLEDAPDAIQDSALAALKKTDQMVVQLNVLNKEQLGGEFFRWEMATAVAGSIMGINPFDQPDVEGSKKLAAQLIADYEKTGKITKPTVLFEGNGLKLLTDNTNCQEILSLMDNEPNLETILRAHFSRVKSGNYVNISAFIEMSKQHIEILQQCRTLIRDNKKVATCLGFGPRFLHSTGQDYKGGPNTGVFLQITADHIEDLAIPGRPFTFGLVIDAQAEADFEVLVSRKRRVLRAHLGSNVILGLQQLYTILQQIFKSNGNHHG